MNILRVYMGHQMAATAVTLNDLEGHSPVAAFSNAIGRTFVQHFTRFQLTSCSRGYSALEEVFVILHCYCCIIAEKLMNFGG